MRKLDREYTDLGIAFLDVIACGFGAIIMLVILAKDTPINSLKQESTLKNVSAYEQNKSNEIVPCESVKSNSTSVTLNFMNPSPLIDYQDNRLFYPF